VIDWQPIPWMHYGIRALCSSLPLIATTVCIGGIIQPSGQALTPLQCNAPDEQGVTLQNRVSYTYGDGPLTLSSISPTLSSQVTTGGFLTLSPQGMTDRDGNLVYTLGTVASALSQELRSLGWNRAAAQQASVAAVQAFAELPADATAPQTLAVVQGAIARAVPNQAEAITEGSANSGLMVALMGLAQSSLQSIGLTALEAETAKQAAIAVVATTAEDVSFNQMTQTAFQDAIRAVPTQAAQLRAAKQALIQDRHYVQSGTGNRLQTGNTLRFHFALSNTGSAPIQVTLPTVSQLQETGLAGQGTVVALGRVELESGVASSASVDLAPGQQVNIWVDVTIGRVPANASVLTLGLGSGCGRGLSQQTITVLPPRPPALIDPPGRITGCDGGLLPDYRGFQVALYRPIPSNNTGDIQDLLPLVTTELPDNPNNTIPAGLEPNRQNSNPFFLTNSDQGRYNFLLSESQIQPGQTYILVVAPPPSSNYSERRVRITIGQRIPEGFRYEATSLDGRPIRTTDGQTSVNGVLSIADAARVGLVLALFDLDTSVCQSQAIQIVKSGDRVSAAPGDTVVYRLVVRNLSTTAIEDLVITDTLPLGFRLVDNSVQGEMQGQDVAIATRHEGSTVTFQVTGELPQDGTLTLAYGAQLTPDALRGTGQNSASASGRRNDNGWVVQDGPAIHRLRVDAGILADCGTILGRVFVDHNFDGEQQSGEPGVPNAVVYLDDGNRITTDANGLFSVANVLPGYRTGALDLTSIPDYTLAPNHRVLERNGPSRLVHLAPGGMVRMNFGVMPVAPAEAGS